ncbi:MAG TPA: glycosyl hydrolase 53 family protein [Polyangiaceae bacterium]|nr:glycosyl hydrolase 53 family protein [Polyangiaceae bacterium]
MPAWKRSIRLNLVFASALLLASAAACSDGKPATSTGGASGVSGGAVGSGGTAGVPGQGGNTSGGTTAPSGGSSMAGGSGGSSLSGGTSSGGASVTGGLSATGGLSTTGGSAGTSTGGGSSGAAGKGGSGGGPGGSTTGGAPATGGKAGGGAATGGTPSTGGSGGNSGVYMPPFILGADVTITMEDEYWKATYTDAGQEKPLEQLLKDHGFNFIRIDTFVNPGAPGGFAETMEQPFRDLAHTITLAKRVKSIGMGFLLDLHYSDTWTNPGAQKPPAAWANLSLSALETQVYNYTKDAVTQLKAASAMPDIVQVGNEITNGMLWESGHVTNSNFTNFATLLKAGIRAVREVNPAIQIMLHIEKCNNTSTSQWWLDGVLAQNVAFDILGQSCYAAGPNGVAGYQGTPAEWQTTFAALATRYPNLKFIVAEYSSQQRAANDTMFNLPNKRGLGTFNWDPTRSYETHPNDPLFSTNGAWNRFVAIPEKMALYEKMAKDYGLR